MAKLSDAQIATVAFNAGIPREQVAKAVAIAIAESGGDANAHNPIPPDDSYGLWQINMLGDMGPQRRQQFGISTNAALYDPSVNAKAMAAISSKGSNWTPWTTFTRGTYLAYMARGYAARDQIGATVPVTPVDTLGIPSVATIVAFVKLVTSPKSWIRFGLFGMGAGLVFVALMKMTGDNKLSPLVKKAAGFVPGLSAVKKVAS